MKLLNKSFFFLFLILCESVFSQGGASSCSELQANYEQYQSCATNIPFNNSTGNTSGENFQTSCIQEPFQGPTWFFMKIQSSGNIRLRISQVANTGGQTDVDFVLWGPFNNMNNICSQLNRSKEVDCSWLPDSVEFVDLNNAVAGQFYILLIDNYSNTPGQITITQVAGTGSSDCSFLSSVDIVDTSGNEITQLNYCKPATKDIVANIDVTDFPGNVADLRFNYKWYKDNVLISTITASTSNTNTLNTSETGVYKVEITAYDSTDPTVNQNTLQVSSDEISLQFYNTPVITSTTISLEQCDYIAPNNDGFAAVNLTETYDAFVNGDTDISLNYYLDAALTQQIADPARFTNTVAFNQDIFVVGNYASQPFLCNSNVGKIALRINPTSVANYPNPAPVCPELNTSFGKIDLDAQRLIIKNTYFPTTNVEINFYIDPADASVETNQLNNNYNFPSGISTVYTRIEIGNNCAGIGTFNVEIYSAPIQNILTPINACETEDIFLISKDTEALAGQNPTVQATYFRSFTNAETNTSVINKNTKFPLTLGTTQLFIRLFDTATSCFTIINFDLNVLPNPVLNSPDPISICGTTTANFNLESRIPQITGNNTNYQVTFYENQANMDAGIAIPTPNSYDSANKSVLIKVIDPTNNGCSATSSLQLKVLAIPGNTTNPEILQECDDSGVYAFDLTLRQTEMAGATLDSEIEFRYYINLDDAENNRLNFIPTPNSFRNTVISYQKIYVRLNSKTNINSETSEACYRILELELFVRPYPKNNLKTQPYRICVDRNNNVVSPAFIETELSEDDYDFVWYNGFNAISGNEIAGEFANNFTTSTTGSYSVKVTNTTNATLCTSVFNFRVLNTVIPFSITADPSSQITFESDASVTAIASPLSPDYQYAVDDSGWQSSNIFENINEGIHVLRVRNRFGCGEITTRFTVVDYPKFFTPNGDSYNDTWNVGGRTSLNISNVYIFDRYGKLLKTLSQNDGGWDGTFNGNPLPADDYWFKILFEKDGITDEFSSHFTLKR